LGLLDEENQDEFDKNLQGGRELAANGDFELAAERFSTCIQKNNEKVSLLFAIVISLFDETQRPKENLIKKKKRKAFLVEFDVVLLHVLFKVLDKWL
jgi:hypothetical protein